MSGGLDNYGLLWNSVPAKSSIENKDANIQAALISRIKQEMAFLFNFTRSQLEQMSKSELAKYGYKDEIQDITSKMSNFDFNNFPGSQPVSFSQEHMMDLQTVETIVCEKSDGVRFFLCEVLHKEQITWFLIDRSFSFR
jgi:hypothetical protein